LAIQTKHFSDVLEYYNVYQDLDHKPEKLQVIVNAALFTCGKFLMKQDQFDKAYQQFEKAVLCSKRNPELLAKCIDEMLKAKQSHLAEKLLKLFSQQDIITPKYKQLEFKVECFRLTKPAILRLGVRMIEDEEADLYVFQTVIRLLEEEGSDRLIKKYKDMGNRLYPDHISLPED
jgi:Tfp pilus assembly protein PilF